MVRHSTDEDLSEKDAKLLQTLEQWGWFVIKVGAGDSEPAFAYSIGLYENFKHPEIILFGLDLRAMHQVINDVGKRIREGERFSEAHRYDDLFEGYECEFRKVNSNHYDGLLNYAIWYYKDEPFPALQLIWPDSAGVFPWEEGYDERFRKEQPSLE
jgi:Domain of unknown function (DUF4262)